ncbi:hypothetical protein [Actinoplanes lobatus]|uniref:Uncharacterized protein n=1 Tax=Actinoplanes lobatus TaxID=113568 RepID=A0A7W7MEV2_9ACTN|nr:hypothetical protein [Actinoplanes lobatus]MBB4747694.1 hypothetical protein [Actinoplanes lobatus]
MSWVHRSPPPPRPATVNSGVRSAVAAAAFALMLLVFALCFAGVKAIAG